MHHSITITSSDRGHMPWHASNKPVMCCHTQVYGSAPTAHGLISEAFLGTAAPDTAAAAAVPAGVDNLAAGLDMVARWVETCLCWGWGGVRGSAAAQSGLSYSSTVCGVTEAVT
jgi:hypothetical protein